MGDVLGYVLAAADRVDIYACSECGRVIEENENSCVLHSYDLLLFHHMVGSFIDTLLHRTHRNGLQEEAVLDMDFEGLHCDCGVLDRSGLLGVRASAGLEGGNCPAVPVDEAGRHLSDR